MRDASLIATLIGSRSLRNVAAVLALAALVALPAAATAKSRKKGKRRDHDAESRRYGGINPTNTALLGSDFELAMGFEPCELEGPISPEQQIGLDVAHQSATGRGVVVAVLDGGFNTNHPELVGRVLPYGYDAIDDDGDPNDYGDDRDDDFDGHEDGGLGHGTFIAGMVLRVAPEALILPIRVRDDEGWGTNEELVRGIEYAVMAGADVINLSVDTAKAEREGLRAVLEFAESAGVVLVVSAGNDGDNKLSQIATAPGVLAVGAVDCDDHMAEFSNYVEGACDGRMIFAPGVDLWGPMGFPSDEAEALWSGTSFSAGFVSGGSALLIERNPWWMPGEVRERLIRTSAPVLDDDGEFLRAGGRLDLGRAVAE